VFPFRCSMAYERALEGSKVYRWTAQCTRMAGEAYYTSQTKESCSRGQEHSVATPYTKVLGIVLYADGFEIHTSAAKKPGIFLVPHPDLTKELLTLASSPETGGNSPPRSRRKKPVPA